MKMKVLFAFGGIPHYVHALLEKMQTEGIEVVVVTPRKGNAIIGKGVKMVNEGSYKHITTEEKKMYYGKVAYPELPSIIEAEKPNIFVVGWPYFLQLFFQSSLKRALKECHTKTLLREIPFQTPPYGKIRTYFEQHPMYDENMNLLSKGFPFFVRQWIMSFVRKRCYSHCDGTLNYSTAAFDILPSYGVPQEKIHVTYNSTDTDALLKVKSEVLAAPPLLPPSGLRILHIGRLVKWKRVDLLLNAFARVLQKYSEAELVIIGDGPELNTLKQLSDDLGVTPHVRFAGPIYKPEELGAYMHESTVYVLAGMGGLSINDAMTYGMPVICSVCDSTERDLVHDGLNGFFFKENDADSLAEKIETLFASPERCKKMGEESERIILDTINIDTVCRRYLDAFNDVTAR
jgi:glycosyltransferase involved in cell wall biosynthesis